MGNHDNWKPWGQSMVNKSESGQATQPASHVPGVLKNNLFRQSITMVGISACE
jgi:hypothetical protein